jgi:hypothetical protein
MLIVAAISLGCSFVRNAQEKRSDAMTATIHLHAKLDELDYDGIHRMFDRDFRLKSPVETVSQTFLRIHERTGVCDTPRLVTSGYTTGPQGSFVSLISNSKCARGRLAAQLTWNVAGGLPQLSQFSFTFQQADATAFWESF